MLTTPWRAFCGRLWKVTNPNEERDLTTAYPAERLGPNVGACNERAGNAAIFTNVRAQSSPFVPGE